MQITPEQVRAVHDTLGLDYDLTLSVTISPGYVHVATAELDENGAPIVIGGVLQSVSTGIEVKEVQA